MGSHWQRLELEDRVVLFKRDRIQVNVFVLQEKVRLGHLKRDGLPHLRVYR